MKTAVKIETIKVSEIVPNENNPRIIKEDKFERLVESIKTFPEMLHVRPLVIDENNVVLGGNMRLKACIEAGLKDLPVIRCTNWSEERKSEFIIKDNVGFGEWDWNILANEWDVHPLVDWGLDVWETEPEEVQGLTDEDAVPEAPEEPITKLGDVWILGEHRVMCGDSTSKEAVEILMDGEKADLLLTDPPYGIGIDGQKESKAKNPKHNRKAHEFRGWDNNRPSKETFNLILQYCTEAIIWGGNYFADLLPAKRGWLVWDKGQKGLTMSDGELAWCSLDKPLRIVEVNRGALKGSVHPTQKPLQVIEFCIKQTEGATIFDPFLGSGTTLIAAEKTNRKCYGMELDPKYCDVIVKRWEEFTGKKATREIDDLEVMTQAH